MLLVKNAYIKPCISNFKILIYYILKKVVIRKTWIELFLLYNKMISVGYQLHISVLKN